MASFIDHVTLHATAGNGGHGCASVHREKFKPLGGPDGGDGGDGGSVILEVSSQETTLLAYHRAPHRRAENGQPGEGDWRGGKKGADLVLPVPSGTVVKSLDGDVLADLVGEGSRYVVAAGGRGGLGNAALSSKKRRAPGFALLGDEGEAVDVILELKSVADVALVGFPSAGKSSLIAAMSAARPKIADYPFTTLVPNLGVVEAGDYRYTIADVPGLIEGASEGKGLGLQFLRHIERCMTIVHVLDCATLIPGRDPLSDFRALETELAAYAQQIPPMEGRPNLMERPRFVVLNKIDVPEARELADFVRPDFEALGLPVFAVSTASHEGLRELSLVLGQAVAAFRAQQPEETEAPRVVLGRRRGHEEEPFTISRRSRDGEDFFLIRGAKPELWVRQTDFSNDEAVGYLADRLNALGVEEALLKAGAHAGDMVVIGPEDSGFIFDWEPTMATGAELLGPRGSDNRFDEGGRATRKEKREQYYERMDAKAAARQELWMDREAGHWTNPAEE